MPVDIERLPNESYLIRVYGVGKKYGDEYEIKVNLCCDATECEIKGLDKTPTREHEIEFLKVAREIAGERKLFAVRHGRRVWY